MASIPFGIWFPALVLAFGGISVPVCAQPSHPLAPRPSAGPAAPSALPTCLSPKQISSSATPGKFCGGVAPTIVGRSLDLNRECKALFGSSASAVAKSQDAYGWVCRVAGQADRGIANMHKACHRSYGNRAIATLVGIGVNDWRCLTPQDVRGHVVPVLLFPVEHLKASEAPFAADSLTRLNTLMSGVRSFYQGKTSALVRGTNAFILPTGTSATDWQNLALCTDMAACAYIGNPYPWDANNSRYIYLKRVKKELDDGQWDKLIANSNMRLAAFVTIGASPVQTPTWCGAADLVNGNIQVSAPSNSYASCTLATNNAPLYEDAFYGVAHELGHAMGMPHSDDRGDPANPDDGCQNNPAVYVFNDTNPNSNLLRPANLADSIMCLGKGTSSELFPFEVHKLMPFVLGWH